MPNAWDNPIPAPSYAMPLLNFSGAGQQQPQGQQQNGQQRPAYSLQNPNPNGLAAKLMAFLNPPQDLSQPLPGSAPIGQGGIGSA